MIGTARRFLPPLLSGSLFGAGLFVGGMVDPQRVIGFLDVTGRWDPTLAFVMGAALVVMAAAWTVQRRLSRPLFAPRFALPDRTDLDSRLVGGAMLFGIGWGLAGICPGPALAAVVLAPSAIAPFVAAMIGGMILHRLTLGGGMRKR